MTPHWSAYAMDHPDLLFVPYQDTVNLLGVDDAMEICEEVYRMLATKEKEILTV